MAVNDTGPVEEGEADAGTPVPRPEKPTETWALEEIQRLRGKLDDIQVSIGAGIFIAVALFLVGMGDNHVAGLPLFYDWYSRLEWFVAIGFICGLGQYLWQSRQRRRGER